MLTKRDKPEKIIVAGHAFFSWVASFVAGPGFLTKIAGFFAGRSHFVKRLNVQSFINKKIEKFNI